MFRPAIRRSILPRFGYLNTSKRCLATVSPEQPSLDPLSSAAIASKMESSAKPGALRPHLGIQVNPNHGLYAFFRKIKDEDSVLGYKYVTYEATNDRTDSASRAWTAGELRRKSFRDLHILWYMCRREINLLATQKAEIRRLHRFASASMTSISQRARQCRKTCSRIKFILNERRLALLNATARIHWVNRPGYKDPAKKPQTKLVRGPQMTEKDINYRMRKLAKKGKLRLLHPELRKRPMLMLKWAPRRGRAKPIRYDSDLPVA